MTKIPIHSRLILILIGISLFAAVGWLGWQRHIEKQHQARLAAFRQETEKQLKELDDLQFRVRETIDHNQTWWLARDFLGQARAELAFWQQRWEKGGRKDGSQEQQMVLAAEERMKLLKPYMDP